MSPELAAEMITAYLRTCRRAGRRPRASRLVRDCALTSELWALVYVLWREG